MPMDTRMRRVLSRHLRDMEEKGLTEDYSSVSRRILVRFVAHCERAGVVATRKITARELRGFMEGLRGTSANSQRFTFAVVKQFLKFAENPLAWKFQWRVMGRPRQVSWLTPEQVEKVLTARMTPREAFLIATGLLAGARQIEIRRLTPKDLKDALSTQWLRLWAKGRLRYVPLHPDLRPVFEVMLRTTDKADGEPVLGLCSDRCRTIVRGMGERVGVRLQSHELRRTFATLTRRAGASLETIQGLLGHSSVQMTAIYLEIDTMELVRAVTRLRVQRTEEPV